MNIANDRLVPFRAFVERHQRLLVLTGAGISIAAGLPAYRDPDGRWLYRQPIQHRDFLADAHTRKRYWARSTMGWPAVRDARPTPAHQALAAWDQQGRIELLVTQNVDRLHQRAGSERVIDLHGRLDRVLCLDCGLVMEREALQPRLAASLASIGATPAGIAGAARPDGDRDLPDDAIDDFRVPPCPQCVGILMPDVVFYGGSVPRARVDSAMAALARADALLAIGTSLQVYSGFRFCRAAVEMGKPLAIINPGPTRADELAQLVVPVAADTALAGFSQRVPSDAGSPS